MKSLPKKVVHWSLLALLALEALTGFGITESRVVSSLTFGILTKPLSFTTHSALMVPLVILLILHIYLTL